MTNKEIAEKWYKKLDFPKEMDSAFRKALESADIPEFLKGLPITLISAAIVSMSFLGFAGLGG